VEEGGRATATGCLVRDDQGDWFQPGGRFTAFSAFRLRPLWRGAVRVTGADFGGLERRVEAGGHVQGWATLTGTWNGGQLQVEEQSAPVSPAAAHPRWETPPCPTPPGGWPTVTRRGAVELAYDLGDLAESGAAVAATLFRPAEDHAVLVVAAADPATVEAWLRPQLGRALCVVPSRWTKNHLDSVRRHLGEQFESWHLLQLGPVHGEDGQPYIAASLARVRPEIADWAATLPSGILTLTPWLTPLPSRPAAAVANGRPR